MVAADLESIAWLPQYVHKEMVVDKRDWDTVAAT